LGSRIVSWGEWKNLLEMCRGWKKPVLIDITAKYDELRHRVLFSATLHLQGFSHEYTISVRYTNQEGVKEKFKRFKEKILREITSRRIPADIFTYWDIPHPVFVKIARGEARLK